MSCKGCGNAAEVAGRIAMAFQPIVDASTRAVFAQEALVRGTHGEPAAQVLSTVAQENRYAFDQACRMVAIRTAAEVGLDSMLSINFLPNAVYDPQHCLQATFAAARDANWPLSRVIFEVAEHEKIADNAHLVSILTAYKAHGFLTAIDDFGAGYAGLNLLADFQPDLVKLDIGLVRGVDSDRPRRAILRHMVDLCAELGVDIIAEGVETPGESAALLDLGIHLHQGFLYARPLLRGEPEITWP